MKPKILLSASNTESLKNYINAVEKSGGIPYPIFSQTINTQNFDGFILCGGGDISPKFYNQENTGSKDINLKRDKAEFKLLEGFIKSKKPILGICRGHQVINVFFGGDLYQDISYSKFHIAKNNEDNLHRINIKRGSKLSRMYGNSIITNSAHHQAIKKVGDGLIETALWNEKLNEAIEHINLPIFSVQWHPERIFEKEIIKGCAKGKTIFDYFISIC